MASPRRQIGIYKSGWGAHELNSTDGERVKRLGETDLKQKRTI